MTGPALVLAGSLLLVFLTALALDFYENRRDWREWREDHPVDGSDPWQP